MELQITLITQYDQMLLNKRSDLDLKPEILFVELVNKEVKIPMLTLVSNA